MPNTHPNPEIDLQQINARNDQARHIMAGCASAMPDLADLWRPVDHALNDAVLLSALVARLSAQVTGFPPSLTAPGSTGPTCAPRARRPRRARRWRARPPVVPPRRAERARRPLRTRGRPR